MKKIYTTFIAAIAVVNINAQTLQLVNNQFLTTGIVDATEQNFYTYKNISTNTTPAPANYELKKLNTSTNNFDLIHSFPNPQKFVNHYPVSIVNNKYILVGDYKGSSSFSIAGRNLFVFNGVSTYDSLFVITDSIS